MNRVGFHFAESHDVEPLAEATTHCFHYCSWGTTKGTKQLKALFFLYFLVQLDWSARAALLHTTANFSLSSCSLIDAVYVCASAQDILHLATPFFQSARPLEWVDGVSNVHIMSTASNKNWDNSGLPKNGKLTKSHRGQLKWTRKWFWSFDSKIHVTPFRDYVVEDEWMSEWMNEHRLLDKASQTSHLKVPCSLKDTFMDPIWLLFWPPLTFPVST